MHSKQPCQRPVFKSAILDNAISESFKKTTTKNKIEFDLRKTFIKNVTAKRPLESMVPLTSVVNLFCNFVLKRISFLKMSDF